MKEKEKVKQQFSQSKHAYITSSTHSNVKDLEALIRLLPLNERMIALDIATGGGHVAKQLAKHVHRVIATDLTAGMLLHTATHLKNFHNIEFLEADAEQLPFESETFDVVTCRYAAHHFPHPEKFLLEVHRVLKKDGSFLFVDNVGHEDVAYDTFIQQLEKLRDYSHIRSLKISEWKQFFQQYGLNILYEKS